MKQSFGLLALTTFASLSAWMAIPSAAANRMMTNRAGITSAMGVEQSSPARALVTGARMLNDHTAVFTLATNQQITVDFYAPNIFRLYQDSIGLPMHNPQAKPQADILVAQPRRPVGAVDLKVQGDSYLLTTSSLQVALSKQQGTIALTDLRTRQVVARTLSAPVIEKDKVKLQLTCRPDEYFYGGGVQNGRFSHKGKKIAIENTNNWVDGGVASPTPFYWSTRGYGVMWHTFRPGIYDFGATDRSKVLLQHDTRHLDCFFMVDSAPAALLNDFYQLTGHPVLLPKFGFYEGHLNAYNRDYWKEVKKGRGVMTFEDGKEYTESQKDNGGVKESLNGEKNNYLFSARAAIDRYVKHDMPLGWFLPNDGYGAGYGQTATLDGNIANLKMFGDYARSKGVEIGLWTQSDLHPKDGVEPLLQRDIVKEVRDAGVRVLKTDVAWVGWGYSFGLNGVADVGTIMPRYGDNARPFIITLDGWAGTQRYAGVWTGDQTGGDWEYIRFHIPTFIGAGLSGQPNVTSDMDGIFGGRNVPVNVREFQWKTFTPMALNMDGWGANPKYPFILGGKSVALNRWSLKLKSQLIPYIYTTAHDAVTGKPMMRPMFMEERNDYTLGHRTQYQYMFGDAFLVAPVYKDTHADKEGNDVRDYIYLPHGTWIDYFTGERYTGGRIINQFDAPLWKLPLFVKADAIIPYTHANNNPSEIRRDYRAYEIYAMNGCVGHEYDDDGKTQAYLKGEGVNTKISTQVKKDMLTVQVEKTTGGYQGFEPEKQTDFKLNVTQMPKKLWVKLDNRKTKLKQVFSQKEFEQGENVWFYNERPDLNQWVKAGEESVGEVIKNPQVYVRLAKNNVTEYATELIVKGFCFQPAEALLHQHGSLAAPTFNQQQSKAQAYQLTPAWNEVRGADYYELEFDGQLYSTLRTPQCTIDDLQPLTSYHFRVRAVNAAGKSDWQSFSLSTVSDPFEWAVKELRAQTSVPAQTGEGTAKLFDRDVKTIWHTAWDNNKVLPFDMIVDLRAVHQLDRLCYVPRTDAGNGTILKGTWALSADRQTWTAPKAFTWQRNADEKCIAFTGHPKARYVKFRFEEAVGGFGSGAEMYVFRKPNTEGEIQGDINRDKRIDENDLTSYMNYTGLRRGDADYDYVSIGDINHNGLIDAYDISCVGVELDGGASQRNDQVRGSLELIAPKTFKAGDDIEIQVVGKNLHFVNALSFALPYNADELEYRGVTLQGMKEMVNLTYDRLHTSGQKALYPTFVNRGNNFLLDEGDPKLFIIKFHAKKSGRLNLKMRDGMLVDRNLGVSNF